MTTPALHFKQTTANQTVVDKCPALHEAYTPTWYLFSGTIHTIVAARGSPLPKVTYERELVTMSDGGVVSLDWLVHSTQTFQDNHPTILIHHGAGGSSRDTYVRMTATALAAKGWRVVAMNSRGCGNTTIKTARASNGFYTGDVRDVATYLRSKAIPTGPLIGVGFSNGANLMVKCAGEDGDASKFTAIVSVSNVYDTLALDKAFQGSWWNRYMWDAAITTAIKRQFQKVPQSMLPFVDKPEFDWTKINAATTLREIDDLMSRRIEGYESLDDYYRDASCANYIETIRVPVLCISAMDDPIATPDLFPEQKILENDHVILVKTAHGGHLGFLQGDGTTMWTSNVIADYAQAFEDDAAMTTRAHFAMV
ncbi:Aste57867_1885 [Aphanomyces stellatus]|uniref:Aste57867_1885 protein n=1 Tax=Aphanomyces stellatus TaxID=120398 RepID=A0A485KAJ6_9STRA|nr:hypothetical protein As57867_001883 [Aphanomyces stellatus]VFT79092.1 Aste57867_1885 [Aphanomyces stellatus]